MFQIQMFKFLYIENLLRRPTCDTADNDLSLHHCIQVTYVTKPASFFTEDYRRLCLPCNRSPVFDN